MVLWLLKSWNCEIESTIFSGKESSDKISNENYFSEFIGTNRNDAETQKNEEPSVFENSNQIRRTQAQITQKSLFQTRTYEQLIDLSVETFDGMDEENELEYNKISIIADKRRVSDWHFLQEMEPVNLVEIFDETDGVMKSLDKTP